MGSGKQARVLYYFCYRSREKKFLLSTVKFSLSYTIMLIFFLFGHSHCFKLHPNLCWGAVRLSDQKLFYATNVSPEKHGRLGDSVTKDFDSKIYLFYNDIYKVKLPPSHRFPMEKYEIVRKGLQNALEKNEKVAFCPSPLVSVKDLETTHCPEYIRRYIGGRTTETENRRAGFPWTQQGVLRSLSSTGGTVAATHAVCRSKKTSLLYGHLPALFSGHIAGGTHHAFFDRGEGFCIFSDIAVAANVALRDYSDIVETILIADLDVHQGNGNAVLFQNESRVKTFSMHCKANYFSEKQQSDFDVEVDPNTSDHEYLLLLEDWLPMLMEKLKPDLIFYQAGVDGLQSDRFGKLSLSREGLSMRNKLLYELALQYKTPTVITMGGGYPKSLEVDSVEFKEVVDAHKDVYLDAVKMYLSVVI